MKGKKPLLIAVLVVALLAVALIVPTAASAKQDQPNPNQPVNWVNGNYSEYNAPPGSHGGFTVNVRQSGPNLTLEGFVLQKLMYTSDPVFQGAPIMRRATEFWPEDDYWAGPEGWPSTGLIDPYIANYASFCGSGSGDFEWPSPYPGPPADWLAVPANLPDDLDDANIVDFILYLQADFIWPYTAWVFGWNPDPVEDGGDIPWYTMPHRYLIVDYDDPEKEDLVQIYGWLGFWNPALGDVELEIVPAFTPPNPYPFEFPFPVYDLVPVPAGNFQVHVGESTPLPYPLFPIP